MLRFFSVMFFLLISIFTFGQITGKIDPKLEQAKSDQELKVVIIMAEQADLSPLKNIKGKDAKATFAYHTLLNKATESQKDILAWLKENKVNNRSFYIVNMISAVVTKKQLNEIALRSDVNAIIEDASFQMLEPKDSRSSSDERAPIWNLNKIGAPSVWAMGITGQNVVIGGQDTGYAWDVATIKNKYRGWNGTSAIHDYYWHDAIHQNDASNTGTNPCGYNSPIPCDDDNHGTHTMGTMVGDVDDLGQEIGVAPGAKWIGCRNMERGDGTLSTYVECFEWFLAPYPVAGGSGDPTKMPHVINNSWGCPTVEGCNTSNFPVMEAALNNLRNAGCVVVVSAGNSGSSCSSVNDPAAIFEGSFSVGATNSADDIAGFSSRGPVFVDSSNRLKPNVSAPGVDVRSCIKNGTFVNWNGTSMAGPHVAGLVALIISANPNLAGEVDQIEDIIEQTAVNHTSVQDCSPVYGASIPNNTFGYGRINALASVQRAQNANYVPAIKIDQFGYRINDQKIAILSDPQNGYNSVDSYTPLSNIVVKNSKTFEIVYSANAVAWNGGNTHTQSGDKVFRFDFSTVVTPGLYHIADGSNGSIRSEDFEIKDTIYHDIQRAAFKTFFYQRCAQIKSPPYVDAGYSDGASHMQDATCRFINNPSNPAQYKNMTGGWYDAGDYNKYINFTAKPINDLLFSYEINPQAWTSDEMNIPESNNGIPDLFDELKYELDWIAKMQDSDGGVFCVVGVQDHATASPPSTDNAIRYYGPKTTSASFSAAMSFAFAAKQFKKINHSSAQGYATLLQTKAINAWNWGVANPNVTYYNTGNIAAGEQELSSYETSMRKLCAAIYLYDLTNNTTYKTYVESNYNSSNFMQWSFAYPFENMTQHSLLYYSFLSGVNATVSTNIKNAFKNSIDNYAENYPSYLNDSDAYLAHLETQNTGWGSNQIKCNIANMYQMYHHYRLDDTKKQNLERMMGNYIHYIHGVNPNGVTYLTNMKKYGADRSINTIYHSWFTDGSPLWDDVRTSTYGPAPGFLSGGPNPNWTLDDCCSSSCGSSNSLCISLSPPNNQPTLKSYRDWNTSWPQNSWEVTENGIYYQSAYLLLLSSKTNFAKNIVEQRKLVNFSSADIYIKNNTSSIILTSNNNTKYKVIIDNNGQLSTSLVASASAASSKIINGSANIIAPESGIIVKSSNNSLWRCKVNNAGNITTQNIASVPGNNTILELGDLSIESINHGIILKDQNNICYLISISDAGVLFTQPTICQN